MGFVTLISINCVPLQGTLPSKGYQNCQQNSLNDVIVRRLKVFEHRKREQGSSIAAAMPVANKQQVKQVAQGHEERASEKR